MVFFNILNFVIRLSNRVDEFVVIDDEDFLWRFFCLVRLFSVKFILWGGCFLMYVLRCKNLNRIRCLVCVLE